MMEEELKSMGAWSLVKTLLGLLKEPRAGLGTNGGSCVMLEDFGGTRGTTHVCPDSLSQNLLTS